MDPRLLVEKDIDAGKRLVEAMEARAFPVVAAYWIRRDESDRWELHLAVTGERPKEADRALSDANRELGDPIRIRWRGLSALREDDPEVVQFRRHAGTPGSPYFADDGFRDFGVGDIRLDAAYIYRAEQLPTWEGVVPVAFAARDRASGTWAAHPGTLTFADGLLVEVACEGVEVRQKVRDGRLKAKFVLVENEEEKDGLPTGTLTRYEYDHGRLWQRDAGSRRVKFAAPLAVGA